MKLIGAMISWKENFSVIAARARKIADSICKALSFNVVEGVIIPKRFLSITLGKGSVAAAYGMLFLSRPRIRGCKRYSFDGARYVQPENLASTISLAIDEFGARGAEIVIGIPREWVMIRSVELPAAVRDNVASAVAFELDRLTPLHPSEAMYDFMIRDEENNKLHILLMATRADILRPYLQALRGKGIEPSRIAPAVTGLGTLCSMIGDKDGSALCVSISDSGYEGCAMKKGAFVASFCGNFPGGDHEKNLSLVKEELTPFLEEFKGEGLAPIVFFNAAPGYTAPERIIGAPVRILNNESMKTMFKTDCDENNIEPLGGLLEALRTGTKRFDLAGKGREKTRKAPMAVTVVLLAFIAATLAVYVVAPVEMEKRRLQAIEYQIKALKGEVKKVEALKREAATIEAEIAQINEFKESRPMTLHVLRELTKVLPKSVWLVRSKITDEKVEIEGYASSATETLPKLEQSDLFKKAEFSSPTTRDTRQNVDRFAVRMEIEGYEKKK
ncbi:MAG: Fimbrial assembly protein (PilN) [Syntrophorhabdus sp. PtaU1.Bin058]|nr:MAG: Fimbrial assembly protein (PilN) [Syntrophorhabdus sp. PtaU1.Bin058]